ncbi:MAG TPA: CotH kinase family protein [Solirubrobacterales bacterium]
MPTALAAVPPPDAAAPMYASGALVEIDLDLSQAALKALKDEPEEYVPGDFTLSFTDGTPGGPWKPLPSVDKVGVRLKGNVGGSFRPIDDKAAFKVKFNEFVKGQKFLGLKGMTLNNMVQDPTMLHETLAYEAFRAAEVPAPRTGYAFVRVNGTAYGVYMNVEGFDDVALARWFGDFDEDTQHLYEGAYGTDVTPGGAGAFEVDEGDDENLADLEALIDAVNADSPAFHTRMEGIADLDEMRRMWGVEKYIGMWDGYAGTNFPQLPNNFFLYSAGLTGPFQMFPWGTDMAWEGILDFDGDAGLMFDECMGDSACRALYMDALRSVGGTIAGLELDPLATCLLDRLEPWRAMEVAPYREYDTVGIEEGIADTREMLEERPGELTAWLEAESGEEEEIVPTGSAASCAVPDVGFEARPPRANPGEPAAVAKVPAVSVGEIDAPLSLRRLRVEPPAVIAAVMLAGRAGKASMVGTIVTRRGTRRVCEADRRVPRPGELTMRCRLTDAARARLQVRRLRVHLAIEFEPADGSPAATIDRSRVVPRTPRD